jgi:hypothetical protein
LAGKTRKKARSRKAPKKKRKQGLERIGAGLQKELDAIVAPIGLEQRGHLQNTDAPSDAAPKGKTTPHRAGRVETEADQRDKRRNKKTYSWGIVIGETD